jgi:hypothetical protein
MLRSPDSGFSGTHLLKRLIYLHNIYKLLRERQVGDVVVGVGGEEEGTGSPLPRSRFNQILEEMNHAQLKELQEAHDGALYKAKRLKQIQQSGTQQHMVVSEKRWLASLIGKTHRARKRMINNMASFVRYIVENTEQHGIPADWKSRAREGIPYWCLEEGENAMAPSILEKSSIVESYLKRQRAWEQITMLLPQETVDAMRFFANIEKEASTFIFGKTTEGQPISTEMKEYHLGSLALCQDILDESRKCCMKCGDLWNTIETELQSAKIISINDVGGNDDDGIPAHRKVKATLPLLDPSNAPSSELLQEHLTVVPDRVQQNAPDGDGFVNNND